MAAEAPSLPTLRFHLEDSAGGFDCIVTSDAMAALGVNAVVSRKHRRFLEGIAAERREWSLKPQHTIVIDAWDIATHRQD